MSAAEHITDKDIRFSELEEKCRACRGCSLAETRTNCVFGVGDRDARLMFVGEAPGEQEDLQGIPFVGRAGQLLDRYLFAVDIKREDVYIANILKCRPPHNRDPLPAEEDACIGFLMTAVYHPAALLRDPRKKDDMLADMKKIKEKLDEDAASR